MVLNVKALACACVLLLGINAIAAGNQAQPGSKTAQNQKQTAPASVKSAEKVLGGEVTAVNAEKKEFSILRNAVQYPVLVNNTTQIVSGKEPIDFSNIAVGDKVTVNYTKQADGTRIALEVEKRGSVPSTQPEPKKSKAHVKAESKKAETSAAAPAAKVEVKAEPKKAEAPAAAPAAKVEVKAEPKKAEAPAAAAAAKVEVKTAPVASQAPKAEAKAEQKPAAPETKAAPK